MVMNSIQNNVPNKGRRMMNLRSHAKLLFPEVKNVFESAFLLEKQKDINSSSTMSIQNNKEAAEALSLTTSVGLGAFNLGYDAVPPFVGTNSTQVMLNVFKSKFFLLYFRIHMRHFTYFQIF